jgi:hypothetical protein
MRLTARAIVALLAAVLATAAAAELVEWNPARPLERPVAVPAGKFAEVCGRLAKGDKVRWTYASRQPLAFNIHYHVGKDVEYPVKQEGSTRASGEFVAPLDQDYCWMWTNGAATDASVAVTLRR